MSSKYRPFRVSSLKTNNVIHDIQLGTFKIFQVPPFLTHHYFYTTMKYINMKRSGHLPSGKQHHPRNQGWHWPFNLRSDINENNVGNNGDENNDDNYNNNVDDNDKGDKSVDDNIDDTYDYNYNNDYFNDNVYYNDKDKLQIGLK